MQYYIGYSFLSVNLKRCLSVSSFDMANTSASEVESVMSNSRTPTTAPSSPPADPFDDQNDVGLVDEDIIKEEARARSSNNAMEEKRRAALIKQRKKKKAETKSEREAKARELDELLQKSAAFSDILTNKTQVLGRVGSSLDGKKLGEHNLQMAAQPKCMVGGTMREYQLEGLTWMYEICSQGMSGILADEMGLGEWHISLISSLIHVHFLILCRKNYSDNSVDCSSSRTGTILGSASHRGTSQHAFKLDGRIPQVGAVNTNRHVPRKQGPERRYFPEENYEPSQVWPAYC